MKATCLLLLVITLLGLAGCYSAPTTTTSYAPSAVASCSGPFCRATATSSVGPTVADQIAGLLYLAASLCVVALGLAGVGLLAGWW
jgi:hypothetical protein